MGKEEMMEIKTDWEIAKPYIDSIKGGVHELSTAIDLVDDSDKKWVSGESLLEDLEHDITHGNIQGEAGFSPALWISKIKKELKEQ
jgi:hypothetical protein